MHKNPGDFLLESWCVNDAGYKMALNANADVTGRRGGLVVPVME